MEMQTKEIKLKITVMKRIILVMALVAGFNSLSQAQSTLKAGLGYYGVNSGNIGIVAEFEYEKYYSESFSLPLRADLGYYITPDYNTLFLEVHKGFRHYFNSGFFVEQSLGIGIHSNSYTVESIYYLDDYGSSVRYRDGLNPGISPSVTLGAGYNITHQKETENLVWIRPKAFWNLGLRGLNLPYFALQVGYSRTFKTKN